MQNPSKHFHCLVWIDHREAKIFHFNESESDRETITPAHSHPHQHGGHAPADKEYLTRVTHSLSNAGAILIAGPAGAKTELANFIKKSNPEIAGRISAIETLDHPSDGALLAHARHFFKADDRMHGLPRR